MLQLELIKGDITTIEVDVIVNAANSSLLGGGGVDGAIHRAGGAAILEECKQIRARQGGCRTGEAVITTAGRLPAKKVIHTVGPVWQDGEHGEPILLRACYRNALRLAEANELRTIAFPNISTGVYGFPKRQAAGLAIAEVQDYSSDLIDKVFFVCFDEENYQIYQKLLGQ
ncbi:MAG TPA: O-acetyl-ADP-ribose deacetylase [Saprospiraceae bacterium]|nr:O-acetyl-ADP-ribose deacetylase [Saprospiraceae bacterium]